MRRLLVPLAAFVLLAAGCAPARTGTLGPAPVGASPTAGATATPRAPAPAATTPSRRPPPASPTTTVPVAPDESGEGGTIVVQLWFVRDGRLAPTRRTLPATVATSRLALTELAAGPSRAEAAAGLTTRVPTGVQVVRIADGVATLAPPAGFADGGAAAVRLRRAQVVWTLTQFPTVRGVAFAGAAPVGRDDYADLLPAIVVTGPSVGDRVTSPVSVTGSAEVFEATVSVRVLDATAREVGTSFTTAACGSGCRGDYRATVRYRVAATGPGTIEVYEVSPRDGSRVNVVAVPVVLVAAGR
ncbi:Gmad2 immunoglobulin-like domain-containing protein [Micromonospora sp. 4G57]|uniref:Gmad2 immunoglobulin-like domain-containing protein n=1 Tax=Micromonospora sicca TaxID=2202420 RepID=A0ABU5J6Y6_9ACTN|nr:MULTISPECIES: Gmad2 immunoglobulin-like domain-containing protein [unclassified Micromonospora]MDZ5443019.1 Gmad2 immunoglobulin-like domain-containing protein [Micromonospora sp. 4G57]MDZ5488269.1 Gmad2 immunoglobulin-like domain-containing protein [Micromonospora sp. 4G53]